MEALINLLFVLVLAVGVSSAQSSKLHTIAADQQGNEQNASPDQQNQEPTQSQEPSTESRVFPGPKDGWRDGEHRHRLLNTNQQWFHAETEKDTYPIETSQDLSLRES